MEISGEELRITPEMVAAGSGEAADWVRALHRFVTERAAEGQTVVVVGVQELLSPSEVGQALGMSRSSVQRRIKDGSLPAVMSAAEETFSPSEVASLLGVSTSTVQRHIADGTLKARRRGAYWRVSDSEVDRYSRWLSSEVAAILTDDGE